jgi:hypothetical protein
MRLHSLGISLTTHHVKALFGEGLAPSIFLLKNVCIYHLNGMEIFTLMQGWSMVSLFSLPSLKHISILKKYLD